MKPNTFLGITAIVALFFGLAFYLFPVETMSAYGVTLDVSGHFIARYLGSAFLGVAVINWLVRNNSLKEGSMQAILLGFFVLTVTGFVASVFDALRGVGNSLVWSTVFIYFILAVGFGYYRFAKPAGK